jgi:hypothetical protein
VAFVHRFAAAVLIRRRMIATMLKSLFIWQLHAEIRLRGCDITNIRVDYFSRGAKNRKTGMLFTWYS